MALTKHVRGNEELFVDINNFNSLTTLILLLAKIPTFQDLSINDNSTERQTAHPCVYLPW